MLRFVIHRAFASALVLGAVSVLTFLIFEAVPNGDPALRMAGQDATPATIAAIRRTWGFDTPVWHQYIVMMRKVFSGTVVSYTDQVNVVSQIERGLPVTLSLALGAIVLMMVFSLCIGVISGATAGRTTDRVLMIVTLTGFSTPSYVIGAVVLYLFAYRSQLMPSGGYVAFGSSPIHWFTHLIMPWLALAIPVSGLSARILRASLLENANEDFVRTARAKGLSRSRIMVRHVLRTSLIPLVSIWGLEFAGLLGGGAILIETVFNLHGVGQYAAQSVGALDVPPILVITLYGAFAVVLLSALVDILYAALDPRIRLSN
jgi:peptide/nickel transport system permease protein